MRSFRINSLNMILPLWEKLSFSRLGRWIFSYCIRFINPYTGALGAQIQVLQPGYAEVTLDDKRRNRNHLNSVHAIALSNLGELTSGIAVLSSLDDKTRGIVTEISAKFTKKARGRLRAVCRCELPDIECDTEFKVFAEIFDAKDEIVSRVDVTWQLGVVR